MDNGQPQRGNYEHRHWDIERRLDRLEAEQRVQDEALNAIERKQAAQDATDMLQRWLIPIMVSLMSVGITIAVVR